MSPRRRHHRERIKNAVKQGIILTKTLFDEAMRAEEERGAHGGGSYGLVSEQVFSQKRNMANRVCF
jgi:hypothetical protein